MRVNTIDAVIELAEQACRRVRDHTSHQIDDEQYRSGFETACEVCEGAIREHVLRNLSRQVPDAEQYALRTRHASRVTKRVAEAIAQKNLPVDQATAALEACHLAELVEMLQRVKEWVSRPPSDPTLALNEIDAVLVKLVTPAT